jgi:hypothetical protein
MDSFHRLFSGSVNGVIDLIVANRVSYVAILSAQIPPVTVGASTQFYLPFGMFADADDDALTIETTFPAAFVSYDASYSAQLVLGAGLGDTGNRDVPIHEYGTETPPRCS